jgi:hypothetical protein
MIPHRALHGQLFMLGSHSEQTVLGLKAVPLWMQYAPARGSPACTSGTTCVHAYPEGHVQYSASSFVFPAAFAQRHVLRAHRGARARDRACGLGSKGPAVLVLSVRTRREPLEVIDQANVAAARGVVLVERDLAFVESRKARRKLGGGSARDSDRRRGFRLRLTRGRRSPAREVCACTRGQRPRLGREEGLSALGFGA